MTVSERETRAPRRARGRTRGRARSRPGSAADVELLLRDTSRRPGGADRLDALVAPQVDAAAEPDASSDRRQANQPRIGRGGATRLRGGGWRVARHRAAGPAGRPAAVAVRDGAAPEASLQRRPHLETAKRLSRGATQRGQDSRASGGQTVSRGTRGSGRASARPRRRHALAARRSPRPGRGRSGRPRRSALAGARGRCR